MKRTLLIMSLVLVIAISIVSGTLAMYTISIDKLAQGSVVAKEFILVEDGTDTFKENVKIAPTETVEWEFAVKNFNDTATTETDMDLDITVAVEAAEGKSAILPLVVKVYKVEDEGDDFLEGSITGLGNIELDNEFDADEAQSHTYKVIINWPSNDDVDIDYAGAGFGTAVKVSVTGTQK